MKDKRNIIIAGFLIVSLLMGHRLFSQSYAKIPIDTGFYWRQQSMCPNFDYQIKYNKDTTINGKTYNKYSTFGRSYGPGACTSFIRHGFLKQDTLNRRVIILDTNLIERQLYDFSKVLGDTLKSYDVSTHSVVTLTVVQVSTAQMSDGNVRKAIWVSNNNCFVEGVGSAFGGLYGANQPLQSNYITEQLFCFGKTSPFKVLFKGLTTLQFPCQLVADNVGISEFLPGSSNLILYPNPTSGVLTINFNGSGQAIATIYNVLGKALSASQELNSGDTLNLNSFPSGIYILQLRQEGNTANVKFIRY